MSINYRTVLTPYLEILNKYNFVSNRAICSSDLVDVLVIVGSAGFGRNPKKHSNAGTSLLSL